MFLSFFKNSLISLLKLKRLLYVNDCDLTSYTTFYARSIILHRLTFKCNKTNRYVLLLTHACEAMTLELVNKSSLVQWQILCFEKCMTKRKKCSKFLLEILTSCFFVVDFLGYPVIYKRYFSRRGRISAELEETIRRCGWIRRVFLAVSLFGMETLSQRSLKRSQWYFHSVGRRFRGIPVSE